MLEQTNRKDFAAQLSAARKAVRLTSCQLARRAGLEADLVRSLERGKKVPSLQAVRRLARALKANKGRSA